MNVAEFKDYMCASLNRGGFLCIKCKDGFGPSMNVRERMQRCYKCGKTLTGVALYIFLNFFLITVFLVIILIFCIGVISAPMTCFIMYSQLIIIACYKSPPDVLGFDEAVLTDTGTIRTVSKVFITACGVLNLDFFPTWSASILHKWSSAAHSHGSIRLPPHFLPYTGP